MRINLIVNSFPTVSETFLFNKVTGLESIGYQVLVCSLNDVHDLQFYSERLNEWSGNKVYYSREKWNFFYAFFTNGELKNRNNALKNKGLNFKSRLKILRKWHFFHKGKPDIIHFAFSGIAAENFEVLDIKANAKIFFSCRGSAEKIRPLVDNKRRYKLSKAFDFADRVHCVSEDMRETVAKLSGSKSKTFINYPSINTSYFSFKRRDQFYFNQNNIPFRILSTGRLHFQKGYVYSLIAIKNLCDKGFNIEYNICGTGPEEGLVMYMIQELGLEKNVIMHGKVSGVKVKSLLLETDIFLLPSIYEGIANAALEAIASGVPLLTTTAGGMNEVIINMQNGIIVDRFSADQLAVGIEFCYNNPNKAIELADKAFVTLKEKFVHEKQIEIYDNEYRRAINVK